MCVLDLYHRGRGEHVTVCTFYMDAFYAADVPPDDKYPPPLGLFRRPTRPPPLAGARHDRRPQGAEARRPASGGRYGRAPWR